MRMPLLVAALLLVPAVATARPRSKGGKAPACGFTLIPLVEGNQWTYNAIAAPTPPPDAIRRLSPEQPKAITVTVKSVETKDGKTVATLEEKLTIDRTRDPKKPAIEERSYESTITCTKNTFDISPNSYYFAGEPGGYIGLEITSIERLNKGTSIKLDKRHRVGTNEWRDDLVMQWKRIPTEGSGATLGAGKIEMERQITPQPIETVTIKSGAMFKSEKLGIITTGRVTLEDPGNPKYKPMELPANWVSQLWISDGTGVVQTLNSFGHMYQLVDTNVK